MKVPCLTIPHCYERAIGQMRSSWLTSVLFSGSFFYFCPEHTLRLAVTICQTPIHPSKPASTAVTFTAPLSLRGKALSLVPHIPSSFPQPAFYSQGGKSEILAFPASTAITDGHQTQFWPISPEGESPGALENILLVCEEKSEECFLMLSSYILFKKILIFCS